jgi:Flp pilus assembly protein TadB
MPWSHEKIRAVGDTPRDSSHSSRIYTLSRRLNSDTGLTTVVVVSGAMVVMILVVAAMVTLMVVVVLVVVEMTPPVLVVGSTRSGVG